MKKIIALLMILTLALSLMVGCGDKEKTYSVAIATDSAVADNGKVTNTGLVLVIDDANKIVAARFDSAEPTAKLDDAGAVVAVNSVETKVEKGDAYTGMPAGSWAKQAKAFEDAIVGKTADEVANLTADLYAGCTMKSTTPVFKSLVAKAFANTNKVTFTTAESFTTGIAIDSTVKSSANGAKVASDLAGVVIAGGKVVACVLDSVEQSYTLENGALVKSATPAVSKNEQGESYKMPAGSWLKQAQAFANSAVGKTTADLANLETVSDALAAAGCTMKNTTAGYKTTIITAAEHAR